jgi:hypothetical protein
MEIEFDGRRNPSSRHAAAFEARWEATRYRRTSGESSGEPPARTLEPDALNRLRVDRSMTVGGCDVDGGTASRLSAVR